MSEELREKIARIIDPSRWAVLDGYLAGMLRKYKGEHMGYDPESFKDKASLAKADSILALIDHLESDGGVEASDDLRRVVKSWRAIMADQVTADFMVEYMIEATDLRIMLSALPVLGVGRDDA